MTVGPYRLVTSIFLKSEYWTSVLFWSWSVRFIIIVAILYIRWFFHHLTRLSGSGGCVGRLSEVILTFVFPAASSSLSSSDMVSFCLCMALLIEQLTRRQQTGWVRSGWHVKGPRSGLEPGSCSEDQTSAHWTLALPTELISAGSQVFYQSDMPGY